MEAPEVPLEEIQEHLHHHAAESAHEPQKKWVLGVALTSAFLAALAAVASLLAGHRINEAMILQLKASDQWAYYQAKGIKASVLAGKIETLTALGKPTAAKDEEKRRQYEGDQAAIKAKADGYEEESQTLLGSHVTLSSAVTMFQLGIAVGAVSALTQRRAFWWVSLVFGALGLFFLLSGVPVKPAAAHHESSPGGGHGEGAAAPGTHEVG